MKFTEKLRRHLRCAVYPETGDAPPRVEYRVPHSRAALTEIVGAWSETLKTLRDNAIEPSEARRIGRALDTLLDGHRQVDKIIREELDRRPGNETEAPSAPAPDRTGNQDGRGNRLAGPPQPVRGPERTRPQVRTMYSAPVRDIARAYAELANPALPHSLASLSDRGSSGTP